MKNNFLIVLINLICFFFIVLSFVFDNIKFCGFLVIIVSLIFCFYMRRNRLLFVLSLIISFINISVGYNIGIMEGIHSPQWQQYGLLNSDINITVLRCILLSSYILSVLLRANISKYNKIVIQQTQKQTSKIITFGIIVILIGILFYGMLTEVLNRNAGYKSVTNPIYEYSCIIVVLLWFYSGSNKWVKGFIILYTCIFSILFLSIGDRSSVVILLVTTFLLFFYKYVSYKKLMLFILVSVLGFNFIGIYRKGGDLSSVEIIKEMFSKGLYIDTISWSYYASLCIASLFDVMTDSWKFIFGYIGDFITGISFTYTGMANYAREHYDWLYNAGGGLYPSFFYGMLGYVGVFIGSFILFYLIHKVFSSESSYSYIFKILIVSLSFRWYLYGIATLFRGVFVITPVLLLLCIFASSLLRRKY